MHIRPLPASLSRSLRTASIVGACLLGIGLPAMAAPEPDPVPTRWQLYVETSPLSLINLQDDRGNVHPYFYMTYEVTNDSGQDLVFAPVFELADDEGRTVRGGRGVPGSVTRRLMDMLENPLLQDQVSVLGLLLQGNDNARQGLVIWPAEDLNVDNISIFCAGFSGETETVNFPTRNGAERSVLFRKTLMLSFDTPGTLVPGRTPDMRPAETRWVMR
ncbi:MAG: hypothetical protein H6815_09660 [Phycisphaeraceae bacterium]|nr:hypothetical protein [Phycisphaerales bacterium]MCB9860703.1 hypothetical protein [Phycisphaeraceae bacterium]